MQRILLNWNELRSYARISYSYLDWNGAAVTISSARRGKNADAVELPNFIKHLSANFKVKVQKTLKMNARDDLYNV